MNPPRHLRRYVDLVTRKHGGLEGFRAVIGQKLAPLAADRLERAGLAPAGSPHTLAISALESLSLDRTPAPAEAIALEAVINADLRPAIAIQDGKYVSNHPLWTQLSTDAAIRSRLEATFGSIGRIELPGNSQLPYGGTGFIVGPGLVMTNRHVAEIFSQGLGTHLATFTPGSAGLNFTHELDRPVGSTFAVRRVVMIHPYWDMALLSVDGLDDRRPLALSLRDARDLDGHEIGLVGYPTFDTRNPLDDQQKLFGGHYGIKRLQPGELHGAADVASFGKSVSASTHDCTSLGGDSGSPNVDLSDGTVIALHFGGVYGDKNYAVPTSELARDGRIIDAGVNFAGSPHADPTAWPDWWARADSTEAVAPADLPPPAPTVPAAPPPARPPALHAAASAPAGSRLELEIPLRIVVTVGEVRGVAASLASRVAVSAGELAATTAAFAAAEFTESLQAPWHDADYVSRRGYDPDFLGAVAGVAQSVPMPTAADPSVLAHTKSGSDTLHYQNFSIRMHAARRIALVTACNLTREPALRKPEPNRDYTRKGLSGLGPNAAEQWFPDPRLDARFQLPDVFYNRDRGSFDKGHLVRREDAAWGRTYDELRRGNGDTYHLTNCSPQIGAFNRSANGIDNWGDLENVVFAQAASERLCVFAGPVLDPADQIFHGVGDAGQKLLVRIPSRFWKVLVARSASGLAAFGFVLEQDLSAVQFTEFAAPPQFVPFQHSLDTIARLAGVVFAPEILAADAFSSVRGIELARAHGIRRHAA